MFIAKNIIIRKNKKSFLLNNISLSLEKGSIHVLSGLNGSGKSTLLQAMTGLRKICSGEISINGLNINNIESKSLFGYVPTDIEFSNSQSVNSFLEFFKKFYKIDEKYASSVYKELRITNILEKKVTKLSTGEKKKVLIAQALIHNPKYLILDEPLANLEATTRVNLLEFLKSFAKKGGSVLIASHNLWDLKEYVHHISIIDNGVIIYNTSVGKENIIKIFNEKIKSNV